MHRTIALLLLTSLAACVNAEATPVQGPDGQPGWYAVSCRKNQSRCYEMAGDVCPGGYEMADSQSQAGVSMAGAVTPTSGYVAIHPTYRGDMLIKCKGMLVQVVSAPPVAVVQVAAP